MTQVLTTCQGHIRLGFCDRCGLPPFMSGSTSNLCGRLIHIPEEKTKVASKEEVTLEIIGDILSMEINGEQWIKDHKAEEYLNKINEVCMEVSGNLMDMPAAIQATMALIKEYHESKNNGS